MLNKAILVGLVRKNPEFTKTDKGINVLKLKIETKFKDITEWHNVNMYGAMALEFKELKDNDLVTLTGRLSTRNYDAKDGSKRYFTNIICETFKKIESTGTVTSKTNNNGEYDFDQIPF